MKNQMRNVVGLVGTVFVSSVLMASQRAEAATPAATPAAVPSATAAATPAAVQNNCGFTITCPADGMNFTLKLASKSNDCTEDDMEVSFKSGEGKREEKFKLWSDWYFDVRNVGTERSTCTGGKEEYPVFKLDASHALLFLRSSGRPGYDFVNAVVMNYKTGEISDQKKLGQSMRVFTGLVKTAKGFKLPLVRDFIKGMTCDCDAGFVEGWMNISVVSGKIKTTWL